MENNKTIHAIVGKDGKPEVFATTLSDFTPVPRDVGDPLRKARLNIVDAATGSAIEEIDVYTIADAVYIDDNHEDTILDFIDFRLKYSNSTKVPFDIGGITKDTTFVEVDLKDIITALLYPEIAPVATLSCDIDNTVFRETGTYISPTVFTLNIKKYTSSVKSAQLLKNDTPVGSFTGITDTDEMTLTYEYIAQINDGSKYSVKVTDYQDRESYSNEISFIFVDPIYYGVYTGSVVDIAQSIIQGTDFTKSLMLDTAPEDFVRFTLNANNQKAVFAIKNQWTIRKIFDNNQMDITSFFDTKALTYRREDSSTVQYTIYATKDPVTVDNFDFYLEIE